MTESESKNKFFDKYIYYILLALILLGVVARFYNIDTQILYDDEDNGMLAAMKFHREGWEAGVLYEREHPPLGKWVFGIPSKFIEADYDKLKLVGSNMYVWENVPYEAFKANYVAIRTVAGILGVVIVLLVFLIAKFVFNNYKVALWSAVITAISLNHIAFSRVAHKPMVTLAFMLGAVYFHLLYLYSKNKHKYLYWIPLFISVIFTIGSRPMTPLLILPVLIINQFLFKLRKKAMTENIVFSLLVGASYLIVFRWIYPKSVQESVAGINPLFQTGIWGVFDIYSLFHVVASFFLTHSYLFAVASMLLFYHIYIMFKNKKIQKKELYLLVWFLLFFIVFSVTFVGWRVRYMQILYIPMIIMMGKPIFDYMKNNYVKMIVLISLVATLVTIFTAYPYYHEYVNFGIGDKEDIREHGTLGKTISYKPLYYSPSGEYDIVFDDLTERGNPNIVTDVLNFLVFYEGESIGLMHPYEGGCDQNKVRELLKDNDYYFLAKHAESTLTKYFCPYFFMNNSFTLVKDYNVKNMKLYKIEQTN